VGAAHEAGGAGYDRRDRVAARTRSGRRPLVERVTGILSNSAWQDRVRRAEAGRRSVRLVAAKTIEARRPEAPCACGCEERVSSGRRFVNREHQRAWMRSGGAVALIKMRWKSRPSSCQ
jgi:hypothetical protein